MSEPPECLKFATQKDGNKNIVGLCLPGQVPRNAKFVANGSKKFNLRKITLMSLLMDQ